MTFELHPNFANKIFLKDYPLCKVLLENEKNYPWILLIPKRPHVSKLMDLSPNDQLELLKELDHVQKVLWNLFTPTQINVAAIGNKTPQLHIHVIARFENDPAWPGVIWDHKVREPYAKQELQDIIKKLQEAL